MLLNQSLKLAFGALLIASLPACDRTPPEPQGTRDIAGVSPDLKSDTPIGNELIADYRAMKRVIADRYTDTDFITEAGGGQGTWIFIEICDSTTPLIASFASIGGPQAVHLAHRVAALEAAVTSSNVPNRSAAIEKIRDTETKIFSNYITLISGDLKKNINYLKDRVKHRNGEYETLFDADMDARISSNALVFDKQFELLEAELNANFRPDGIDRYAIATECGGSGWADFELDARPTPVSLFLIGKWGAEVCRAQGKDPFDQKSCRGWRKIATPTSEVVGSYHYAVSWNDGGLARGEIQFEGRLEGSYRVELSPTGVRYVRAK